MKCFFVWYSNGLSLLQFVKRFGVKRICEFYGATEGNSSVINIDSKQVKTNFMKHLQ